MRKLYTDHLADLIVKSGDTKYRPSNGTEGEMFMEMYCYQCTEDPFCEIIGRTMIYEKDDDRYPKEWTYKEGQPCCTKFSPKEDVR